MNSVAIRKLFPRSLFALALVMLLTFSVSGAAAAFKNIKVGDQALPVQLVDLDGVEHSLARYKDSPAILLFFWATWSQRSLTELADLEKFQAQYGDKGLQILAINVENQSLDDDDRRQIQAVLEENQVTYPVLIDEGLKTYNEWGVIATPTTAIVTADGVVSFDLSSYPTSAYLDMEAAIQKALGLYVKEDEKVAAKPSYVPARDAMLHLGLGKRHVEKGFMTKALPELEKAAVADSGWSEPHMYLGFVHFRMGENEKAAASLQTASGLKPTHPEINWLRSYILVTEEKVDDAIALLQSGEEGQSPPEGTGSGAQGVDESGAAGEKTPVLDLSEVLELRDAGKPGEAGKVLEERLSGVLEEAGFTMVRKKKMNAMEKMKLMMQEKQGQ